MYIGVGEKTATLLLKKYKTIDEIYKNLNDLTPKIKNSFEKNKELKFQVLQLEPLL